TPTHLNIIVLSSDKDAPQPNSTLYIDNLTFEYPLISETSSLNKVQLYTYQNKVIINNIETNSQITVFNSNGQIVFEKYIHDANYSFNIEQKGIYFVSIKSNQNVLNKKIAILE
ncbi:MAG: T9SS type A sorting domain-containing protein, partial [Bacteroidales bacterium]|nr:T9SS type A sorting domain-containing protein [Bacteroidales bacterium]